MQLKWLDSEIEEDVVECNKWLFDGNLSHASIFECEHLHWCVNADNTEDVVKFAGYIDNYYIVQNRGKGKVNMFTSKA